jgi:hypothetical protein
LNYNKYSQKNTASKWSVYSFIESDIKTQTLLYDLTQEQVEALRNSNNTSQIWIESALLTPYHENKILYKKINNGNTYYYEHTTQDLPELYTVKFTYVGKNKGDYNIKQVVANGKIYEYTGFQQGDYLPVIKLTSPTRKAYAGFNYTYNPNEKTNVYIDGLINYHNHNLFTTDNQIGGAIHTKVKQLIWQKHNNHLATILQYDYTDENFQALDIYRSVEFNREWQIDSLYGKQHFAVAGINFQNKNWLIDTGWRFLQLRDTLSAQQTFFNSVFKKNKWSLINNTQYTLQSYSSNLKALNINQTISYEFDKYILQAEGHLENRDKSFQTQKDSLNYQYSFGEIKWVKKDSIRFGFEIFYRKEVNDSIYHNQWKQATDIDRYGLNVTHKTEQHRISLFAQYNNRKTIVKTDKDNYLNLDFLWKQYFWNKFITSDIKIASFNGNTRRDEMVFVETPPGQGTHRNDYNGNGIQEINEFEVAVYADQANYIRVILPSKNYIPTLNNRYNASVSFNPEVWKKNSIFKHLYAVFRLKINLKPLNPRINFH